MLLLLLLPLLLLLLLLLWFAFYCILESVAEIIVPAEAVANVNMNDDGYGLQKHLTELETFANTHLSYLRFSMGGVRGNALIFILLLSKFFKKNAKLVFCFALYCFVCFVLFCNVLFFCIYFCFCFWFCFFVCLFAFFFVQVKLLRLNWNYTRSG